MMANVWEKGGYQGNVQKKERKGAVEMIYRIVSPRPEFISSIKMTERAVTRMAVETCSANERLFKRLDRFCKQVKSFLERQRD